MRRLAPNDYLRFTAEDGFMYVSSRRSLPNRAEVERVLDMTDKVDGSSYRTVFPEAGTLIVLRDGAPFQGFRCAIAAGSSGPDVQAGDLLLTELPGAPKLRRVQRRMR